MQGVLPQYSTHGSALHWSVSLYEGALADAGALDAFPLGGTPCPGFTRMPGLTADPRIALLPKVDNRADGGIVSCESEDRVSRDSVRHAQTGFTTRWDGAPVQENY